MAAVDLDRIGRASLRELGDIRIDDVLSFNGEERVTSNLEPFVWAEHTPEIEVFLSTQMVDEARHTVFFQRWWHDVAGTDAKNLGDLLKEIRPEANEGYNTLFYDRLPA